MYLCSFPVCSHDSYSCHLGQILKVWRAGKAVGSFTNHCPDKIQEWWMEVRKEICRIQIKIHFYKEEARRLWSTWEREIQTDLVSFIFSFWFFCFSDFYAQKCHLSGCSDFLLSWISHLDRFAAGVVGSLLSELHIRAREKSKTSH